MNKPAYLGLSILELSNTLMYDYVKPKYGKKQSHNILIQTTSFYT